jgi:hypothetical protein
MNTTRRALECLEEVDDRTGEVCDARKVDLEGREMLDVRAEWRKVGFCSWEETHGVDFPESDGLQSGRREREERKRGRGRSVSPWGKRKGSDKGRTRRATWQRT